MGMILTVGKKYRTADGGVAIINYKEDTGIAWPFIVYGSDGSLYTVTEQGYFYSDNSPHPKDLVAEIVDAPQSPSSFKFKAAIQLADYLTLELDHVLSETQQALLFDRLTDTLAALSDEELLSLQPGGITERAGRPVRLKEVDRG